MKSTVVFILLIPLLAQAGIKSLSQEFTHVHSKVLENRWMAGTARYQFDGLKAQHSLFLEGSSGLTRNRLAGLSGTKEIRAKNLIFSLSKKFDWGTSVKLENNFFDNDQRRSQAQAEFLGIQNQYYEFQNVLSLSQDLGKNFFGREFRSDLRLAKINEKVQATATEAINENLLLEFYIHYVQAKLHKTLMRLQGDGLERANERKKIIARRVRDGLLEKVDLYKAEMLVLTQQENLNKAKQDYIDSKKELSTRLHRHIHDAEILSYSFESVRTPHAVSGSLAGNIQDQAMQKKIDYINENLAKLKYGFTPIISLNGKYKTNSNELKYEKGSDRPRWKEAIDHGRFGSDHFEYAIGVTVKIPWGFQETRIKRSKAHVELLTQQMQRQKYQENLVQEQSALNEKIGLVKTNIGSSETKWDFAKKSLKETNRLYNLGRTNLDNVILSEEELIKTEVSFASFQTSLEALMASKAILYGTLFSYLQASNE